MPILKKEFIFYNLNISEITKKCLQKRAAKTQAIKEIDIWEI